MIQTPRRQRDRLRKMAKVRRRLSRIWTGDTLEMRVRKVADHPATCSEYCCGNPRRFWKGNYKITMQERRNTQPIRLVD